MAHVRYDDDDDFWGRPSAQQRLEQERAQRKSQEAEDWRRNIVGILIFCALMLGAFVLLR